MSDGRILSNVPIWRSLPAGAWQLTAGLHDNEGPILYIKKADPRSKNVVQP